MDRSGQGAGSQGHPRNQLAVHQSLDVQQWMRQREELRQMKAVIEDAEWRMEMGIYNELGLQPMAPTQPVGQSVPNMYLPAIGPPQNPFPNIRSPPIDGSTRIVEIDSSTAPPNESSAMANSNFTSSNISSPQVFSHPGPSFTNASQQGSSNVQYSHHRPQAQYREQQQHNNIPISSSNGPNGPHPQTSSHYLQRSQIQATNATYHAPHQMPNQQGLPTSYPFNTGQNRPIATNAYGPVAGRQSGSRFNAIVQPSLNNYPGVQHGVGPQPAGPSHRDPKSQSFGAHISSNPQETSQSSTHGVKSMPSVPVSYTISSGPGQMSFRGSANVTETPRVAPNEATQGTPDMALTTGFGPTQARKLMQANHSVVTLGRPNGLTTIKSVAPSSTERQSLVNVVRPSLTLTSPVKREAHTLVPVSSPSTVSPDVLTSSQNQTEATPDVHLSALEELNNLLAGHDHWSDDASNRILNSVLGTSDAPTTPETGSKSQVAVQPPSQVSDVALVSEQANTVSSISPQAEVFQILDTHESLSNTESALPNDSIQTFSSPKAQVLTLQPQMQHHLDSSEMIPPAGDSIQTLSSPKATVLRLRPQMRPQMQPQMQHHLDSSEMIPPAGDNIQTLSSPKANVLRLRPQMQRHLDSSEMIPPAGIALSSDPRTPVGTEKSVTVATPSSSQANRHTLAQDIIRALQPPSTKRKRTTAQDEGRKDPDLSPETPLAKKSRTIPINGASQTEAVSGVANTIEANRQQDPRFTYAASAQQPHAPAFDPQPMLLPPSTYWHHLPYPPATGQLGYPPLMMPQAQPTPQNNTYMMGHSWQRLGNSNGMWHPYAWIPPAQVPPSRSSGQNRPPEAGPSGAPRQNQATTRGPISITNTPVPTITQASQQQGPSVQNESLSSPKPPVSKAPLFLPSSESPPPSLASSPSRKPSGLIPVVELGKPLTKLKPKAQLVKGRDFPKDDVTSASTLPVSTPEVESFFGKPTGALAASGELLGESSKSRTSIGIRRSRSKVYILVPKVDTRAWLVSRDSSVERETSVTQNEQLSDRRRPIDEEAPYVQDFARRLIQRSCLWKNCGAVLDSTEKLLKHVKIVHGTYAEHELYRCHWKGCQSSGCYPDSEKLVRHLQWHVRARLYCGYEDCDFQTRLAERLAEHVADDHDENEALRLIAVPIPLVAPELPLSVNKLPSYLSVPREVTGRAISKERHQRIAPLVLHRIFGKVDFKKGAVSLRSQRLLERLPEETPLEASRLPFKVQEEYDDFMKKEVPSRSFGPLKQLPHVIEDIDVEEEYFIDDTIDPEQQPTQGSLDSYETVMAENTLPDTEDIVERKQADESIQNVDILVPAVREDIDSREVEELLR